MGAIVMCLRRTVIHSAILCSSLLFFGPASPIHAHPSCGIVVDEQGQVVFSDLSRGVLTIGRDGEITALSKEGQHWLALDSKGSFSRMDFQKSSHWPRWFKRRTPSGTRPAILGDGGSPITVGRDGNLYYVCGPEDLTPGGLLVARLTPDGQESLLSEPAFRDESDALGGIKGLATGPDGSLYASYRKAIMRFTLDGKATTVCDPVVVEGCELAIQPSWAGEAPSLQGLALDPEGDIYVAATRCRCVIRISHEGRIETILKAEAPWSPTGVALADGEVYVLEYNVIDDQAHNYVPRVRKLTRDGMVIVLATFLND